MTASEGQISAVIVDDEARAQSRLERMLADLQAIHVTATAQTGAQAITVIDELRPDLIFLDVQLPDMDGFEVLRRLAAPPRYVIFMTAYDQYALDAFVVGAVDYLLKPFSERDLERAVARARERSASDRFRAGYDKLLALLDRPRCLESIPVTYMKHIVLIPVAQITHFQADNELVALFVGGTEYTCDLTLADLEQRLDPARFFRAHRRTIINMNFLLRLEPLEGSRYRAVLEGGLKVEVSRTASRKLREKIGL